MSAQTLTHRPFEELGGKQKLVKVTSKVTRIHPTVIVRRPDAARAPQEEPAPQPAEQEPEPVAKKKRAPKASAEQREIAVARVTTLVKAGETRDTAIARVGKELGYSDGALNKWLIAANKGRKSVSKKATRSPESIAKQKATLARKKRSRARASRSTAVAPVANGHNQANAIGEALTMVVREIVLAEFRRLVAQGIG